LTAGLEGPLSLALVDGQLYVAEGKGGRISRVDPATGKKEVFLVGMMGKPVSIGAGGAGDLLVLDGASQRLYRVGIPDLVLSVVAANLPIRCYLLGNYPSYEFPWPMSVGADGSIYLGTTQCGVIMLKKVR
jgi:hypothetical protein